MEPRDTSKNHFYLSLVKSCIRIIAGGALVYGNIVMAGGLLIAAEVVGVLEEIV